MRDQTCFRARLVLTAAVSRRDPVRFRGRPCPSADSAGVGRRPAGHRGPAQLQGPVRRLSIDEAVALALEQNVDLQVDRIDPQVQDYSISVATQRLDAGVLLERHDPQRRPTRRRTSSAATRRRSPTRT